MTKKVENTLYVTKNEAYVRKKQDIIIVEVENDEALRIPGHHLGNIVLFDRASISHKALAWCGDNDVSVSRLDRNGNFIGRWVGPQSGNVNLRLDQFRIYRDDFSKVCSISSNMVRGKLFNSRAMLLRSARDSEGDIEKNLRSAADRIENMMIKTEDCEKLDKIRGFEGRGAKIYFSRINDMMKADNLKFKGRKKRPPKDEVNAMFSYLYVLLLNDCNSALESIGLDPQIGFLHAVRPGKPALALDLMEELRPIMAERVALTLINRQQVRPDDFQEKPGGAILMKEDCRKLLIKSYQDKKHEEIYHPVFDRKVSYGLIPYLQARLLARFLRGDIEEYTPFLYK